MEVQRPVPALEQIQLCGNDGYLLLLGLLFLPGCKASIVKLLLPITLAVVTIIYLLMLTMVTVELVFLSVVLSVKFLLVSSGMPEQLLRIERLNSWLERLSIRSESAATPTCFVCSYPEFYEIDCHLVLLGRLPSIRVQTLGEDKLNKLRDCRG